MSIYTFWFILSYLVYSWFFYKNPKLKKFRILIFNADSNPSGIFLRQNMPEGLKNTGLDSFSTLDFYEKIRNVPNNLM